MTESWQPTANQFALIERAKLNQYIRSFFAERQVLEVETPLLNRYPVADHCITPLVISSKNLSKGFLHTSPEYAMKRLLAGGSGDIYQLCKVFRDGEAGGRHNPEFTMLEWYRLDFNLEQMMREVAQLLTGLFAVEVQYLSYQQALLSYAELDVFTANDQQVAQLGIQLAGSDLALDRDGWLDIIVSHLVEPKLEKDQLTFIYHYPASQAALAKIVEYQGYQVAERFEVFYQGIELANGYHELTDGVEQAARFDAERQKTQRALDQYLLAALDYGLPDCSGVAIGVDRLLMLLMNLTKIEDILSFSYSRA